MKPLAGLTVVEVAGSIAGAYCGKVFADLGATVTVAGERTLGPHQQAYLDDKKAAASLASIDIEHVDVLIESSAPDPLVPAEYADNDRLVRVQISPFGMSGDRAGWRSTDLVDYALSGHAYLYGDPEREPLRGPPDQPAVAAGLYAFIGAMASLLARGRLGRGQTIDVSHAQVMAALHQVTLLRWMMNGDVFCRMGNRYTGQGQPNGPYPCRNGWVSIAGVTTQQMDSILAVTGLTHLLDHPDINSLMDFHDHPHLIDEPLTEWLSSRDVDEIVELFQAMRIPTCPLLSPAELLEDPQLLDRAFFSPLRGNPDVLAPNGAFSLGHHQTRGDSAWQPGDLSDGPLAGLKVLDLARVWAGPLCARILRDLGAEVVWVEAPWHRGPQTIPQSLIDATRVYPNDEAGERPWNRNTHFVKYALGKQSLAVDLQTEAGRQVLRRLVPHFHVLLENFSTRVMPQFELGEDELHDLNPDLIYLTMPGYGRSGPAEHWLAYGSSVDSHAGLSSLIGYRDSTPWKGGIAWPDPIAGLHAASAVLAALWSGLESGSGGLTIEGAQFESTVAAIGDRIVEAQVDGPYVPDGNRDSGFVAQGVYRCRGEDEWIAISVPDADTLGALAATIEIDAELAADHDAFDRAVTAITVDLDAAELTSTLQAAGVPAGKVAKGSDVMTDPHLESRDNWETMDQPDVGTFTAPVTPIALSATPLRRPTPAPLLGEHNTEVLQAAGFTSDEIAHLTAEGVLVTKPPA